MYVFIYVCFVYVCLYVCMYVCMFCNDFVYVSVCMYVCTVFMQVCMYIRVCMYDTVSLSIRELQEGIQQSRLLPESSILLSTHIHTLAKSTLTESCSNPGADILSTIQGGGRVTPSHVNGFLGGVYSPSGMRLVQWITIAMDNNGHNGSSYVDNNGPSGSSKMDNNGPSGSSNVDNNGPSGSSKMDNNGPSGSSLLSPLRIKVVSDLLKTFDGQYR